MKRFHRPIRPLLGLSLALAATLAVACAGGDHSRQGWWENRGPVLPHDKFPGDCSLCHTGEDWSTIRSDFRFDHEKETGVKLEGAHASAQCLRCHNDRGPVAEFAAQGCAGCHEDIHQGQLGQDCANCHEQNDWRPQGQIEEHRRTGFPLVGAHAATPCFRCHPGSEVGVFTPTDTECVTCHQGNLAQATEPDHRVEGWVMDCDRCHIPTAWTGAAFNHGLFPLTGAHASLACSACHAGGVYSGLPRDCYSCHSDAYNSTTNPDHVALNFPTQCQNCHSTVAWIPATFNHSGITDACVTCHLQEYLNTTNPDHQASGFPTTCENCHDTIAWSHGTFNHSFPITSGKHAGFACTDCHINGTYPDFSCIDCHEHNQSKMDDKHRGVSGYVWESNACLACHPDGRGGD